jgi:hypothetical protein
MDPPMGSHRPYNHWKHSRPKRSKPRTATDWVVGLGFLALMGLGLFPQLKSTATALTTDKELAAIQSPAYYPNCSAARAAGVAPLNVGDPGYRSEMDGDGDGVACEPYYGD